MSVVYYHGGAAGLTAGDVLTGTAERGSSSANLGHLGAIISEYFDPEWAEFLQQFLAASHDPGKVYVTDSLDVARAYAGEHRGSLYQVEPLSVPVPSGEREFAVDSARVVSLLDGDVPPFTAAERLQRLVGIAETVGARLRPEPTSRLLCDSLVEAIPYDDGLHGVEHVRAVFENALEIADSDADLYVVAAFAALHDACRVTDGPDPEHGLRAAALAAQLIGDGLLPIDDAQAVMLFYALAAHDQGLTTSCPTIGCCWDADRVDLPRAGIRVVPDLLSTATAIRRCTAT